MQFYTENSRFAFLSPFLDGFIGAIHLKLIGKRIVHFLVLTELFSLHVTAEALLAIIDFGF